MSWTRIDNWFRTNAPAVHATFQPPASGADIAAAEEIIGTPLPADVAAWWRAFGGQSAFTAIVPPWWRPHSISSALSTRDMMIEVTWSVFFPPPAEDEGDEYEAIEMARPAGTPHSEIWLPAWVPIAASGGGDELFVDLRGGPAHGCVMEWTKSGGASQEPFWPSISAMFDDVVRALEGNDGEHQPVVDEDGFNWA